MMRADPASDEGREHDARMTAAEVIASALAVHRYEFEENCWVCKSGERAARDVLNDLEGAGLVVVSREDLRAVLGPEPISNVSGSAYYLEAAARLRVALTEPEQADG